VVSVAEVIDRRAVVVSAEGVPALPALVAARTNHRRVRPTIFAFSHRVTYWLVDIDRLPRLPRWLRLVASFDGRDHFSGGGIRHDLDALLAENGVDLGDDSRVVMLACARAAGHVFNPLSVYWCLDRGDRLVATVLEVHNTYGQRHAYVLRPDDGDDMVAKQLYVSPFNDMSGAYRVRARLTDAGVGVSVALEREGQLVFTASLNGTPRPATRKAILMAALRSPLAGYRVSALIRLHGIRLWLRRLPVQPRPEVTR